MAAGVVPAISSEVGAAADLIIQGETGFVFPFGDWQAMKEQIERLVSNHALRRRMAATAGMHVHRYGYDAVARGIVECLTALGVYRSATVRSPRDEGAYVRN